MKQKSWTKRCRLTGRDRTITCRLVSREEHERYLRSKQSQAAARDAERRSKQEPSPEQAA